MPMTDPEKTVIKEIQMGNKQSLAGSRILRTLGIVTLLISIPWQGAGAKENLLTEIGEAAARVIPHTGAMVPSGAQIEVGFSPDEGAEALVLKVIDSANKEIRLLGYSFTSASITRALLNAKHRGVDVALIVDTRTISVRIAVAKPVTP